MTAENRDIRRGGIWRNLSLWTLFYVFLAWFGRGFFLRPLIFIASGKWFRLIASGYYGQPFPNDQAGFSMDRPTVGKYLFWFLALTVFTLAVAALIRRLSDIASVPGYRTYAAALAGAYLVGFTYFLLPAGMLFHYLYSRGVTAARLEAAAVLLAGALLWIAAAFILFRRNRKAVVAEPVRADG